jgi:hypothetical protein
MHIEYWWQIQKETFTHVRGALSLARERVYRLRMLMALASAVIFGFDVERYL